MSERWYLAEQELRPLLEALACNRKAVNARLESDSSRMRSTSLWLPLEQVTDAQLSAGLRAVRPVNSFKYVLTPQRELVARYGKQPLHDPLEDAAKESPLLVGMRGCDCRALGYLDKVMLREPVADPFYKARREHCIVVGVDCVSVKDCKCFCNLQGEKAYPETNFDISLSPIEGGYIVVAGSAKGEEILRQNRHRVRPPTEENSQQQAQMRLKTAGDLQAQNAEFHPTTARELSERMPKTVDELFWFDEMELCVQCGGCTNVCPTCYCFLLYDRPVPPAGYERARAWDSCQFTGYSVMAGPPGTVKPDPRRDHMSKFQRRFAHKFWHDVLVNQMLGCVGCGRCIETCPGLIDLRRIITAIYTVQAKT